MKLSKKNLYVLFLLMFLVLIPIISFADTQIDPNPPGDPNAGKITNPLGNTVSVPELIQKILEGALEIGIPIIALAIIYCGFLFVAARGKPEAITKAKSALLYTLVGAAILLGSWAIATLISNTVTGLKT